MDYRFDEHLQECIRASIVGVVERYLTMTRVTLADCLLPFPLDLVAMELTHTF